MGENVARSPSSGSSNRRVVERGTVLPTRVGHLELLDRARTLAVGKFVTLVPLILVRSAALAAGGVSSVVAEQLIDRLGVVGAAARAVEQLIAVRGQGVHRLGFVVTLYSAFSLWRRASRACKAIWRSPQSPLAR